MLYNCLVVCIISTACCITINILSLSYLNRWLVSFVWQIWCCQATHCLKTSVAISLDLTLHPTGSQCIFLKLIHTSHTDVLCCQGRSQEFTRGDKPEYLGDGSPPAGPGAEPRRGSGAKPPEAGDMWIRKTNKPPVHESVVINLRLWHRCKLLTMHRS